MNKPTLFVICSLSLLLCSCGLRVDNCVVDYPVGKAHCSPTYGKKGYDLPLDQMEKFSCMSADDFAELLRLNTKNITVCTVVDFKEDDVHCSSPSGALETTMAGIHKFSCFSPDDFAEIQRYIKNKKKNP